MTSKIQFLCFSLCLISLITIGNCKWAPWQTWTDCTQKCGGGTQNRTRVVLQAAANGGQECKGESTAFRDCNTQKCPSKNTYLLIRNEFRTYFSIAHCNTVIKHELAIVKFIIHSLFLDEQ